MEEWIKLLAVPAVVVVVWLVRMEGRQNSHERECAQRQKNNDERHVTLTETLKHMDAKLDRLVEQR